MTSFDRADAHQSWCFRCQYPGKRHFIFGTIIVPFGTPMHIIMERMGEAWAEVFPFDPPAEAAPVPGMILFVPEEAAE